MQTILKPVLGLVGLSLFAIGAIFMMAPNMLLDMFALNPASAENTELAWSTVRGDMGGLFLTLGAAICLGVLTNNKTWLHAAMLLMGSVFVGRAIGVAMHGGDQQVFMNMGVEVVTVGLLWLFARGIGQD